MNFRSISTKEISSSAAPRLIAHNRGIVNRSFLSRLPGYPAAEGELVSLEVDRVLSELVFLTEAAFDIDARVSAKFGLPTMAPPDRAADAGGNGGATRPPEIDEDAEAG